MLATVTLRRFIVAMLICTALPQVCMSKGQQEGLVNMTGSIFDGTCSIDTPSQYQEVLMTLVPVGQIIRDGLGPSTQLTIGLVGCPPESKNGHFWATFYGEGEGDNSFHLTGDAAGVSLHMVDAAGSEVHPGVPLELVSGRAEKDKIDYILTLMGNGEALQPGTFQTTLRMKLEYY